MVNIRDICFNGLLNGWLIDSKHIYHTIDGGEIWNEVFVDADMSTYFFMYIICFNNTIYLFLKPQTVVLRELIDAKGLVYKSKDAGKTWEKLNVEIKGKLLCTFFLNENVGFMYTEETVSIGEGFTSFYKTNDGGLTWIKTRFPEHHWTLSMCFIDEQTGFIGKYRTNDGGETWENMFNNLLLQSDYIDNIFFEDSIHAWAVSWNKILHTEDEGFSWRVISQSGSHGLSDIDFSMNGTGWIVGWAGNILRKGQRNDIWEQLSEGTKNNLNDVFFIDENTGWCVGWFGCILHTSDGGETWEEQYSPVDSVLFKVKFLNNLEGWIVGHYTVLHTKDGGNNWEERNDLYGWFVDIDFFDDKYGILIERNGAILQTTNSGVNWLLVNNKPLSGRLTSIGIVDENEAWIGGWQGLGHTTDKGSTIQWYDIPNLLMVRDIQFVDYNIGFLSNDFGDFFGTNDGGLTWRTFTRGKELDDIISAFFALNTDTVWINLGPGGNYLKQITTNHTLELTEVQEYWIHRISSIFFINSSTGWAVGDGGSILRYSDHSSPPLIIQSEKVYVYPNPFSKTGVYITFSLRKRQHVRITIHNSLGQMVNIVNDKILYEGDKTLFWNPGNISWLYVDLGG